MATPAKKTETAETAPRKIPRIEPNKVVLAEHEFRNWFVRLPDGITFQDLSDAQAEIWQNVQGNPGSALRQFDNVRAVTRRA